MFVMFPRLNLETIVFRSAEKITRPRFPALAFLQNYISKLEEKGLLKQEEKVRYFGSVEELISAHSLFLEELKEMLEKWDHQLSSIGRIFKQQVRFSAQNSQCNSVF
jgi:hypothetical protein